MGECHVTELQHALQRDLTHLGAGGEGNVAALRIPFCVLLVVEGVCAPWVTGETACAGGAVGSPANHK